MTSRDAKTEPQVQAASGPSAQPPAQTPAPANPGASPKVAAQSPMQPGPVAKTAKPSLPAATPADTFVGTPLPAPPPSLPAATIARGVWRGTFRVDAAINWSVPLPADGTRSASGDLFGFGAELAASVRVISLMALGLRWGINPHQNVGPSQEVSWLFDARAANRLMFFARGYWPTQSRFQPFGEIAGGLLYLDAFGQEGSVQGSAWGASVGSDLWVLPGWSLWAVGRYRGTYLYSRAGHRLELALGASLHF